MNKPGNQSGYNRKGFSLVELLVAMAIIIFMLSIMSQAFVIATTCMSGLKGVGELLDKSRPVLNIMQKDLSAYHFDGMRRLSDSDFWVNGPPSEGYFMILQDKPYDALEGTTSDGVSYARAGSGANHILAFTSRLAGNSPESFYIAPVPTVNPTLKSTFDYLFNNAGGPPPGCPNRPQSLTDDNSKRFDYTPGVIHSRWAEVAYFVRPSASNKTANGTPLVDLFRQQKIVLPSISEMNQVTAGLNINHSTSFATTTPNLKYSDYFYNFSIANNNNLDATKDNLVFNSPRDLTVPWRRIGNRGTGNNATLKSLGFPTAGNLFDSFSTTVTSPGPSYNHPGTGTDLLLNDVISFEVKIVPDAYLDFVPLSSLVYNSPLLPVIGGNTGYEATRISAFNLNTNYYSASRVVFDTWTTDRTSGVNSGIKYDGGDYSSGMWLPTTTTPNPPQSPTYNRVPFWNTLTGAGLRINAIQVSIRIWDEKSQKAREFKLIQRL